MAMNKEIKMKWVKALRSGKYKQGFGTMRDSKDCFCVLGVLCNLHAEAHPHLAKTEKVKTRYFGESAFLPNAVRIWAGLKDKSPLLGDKPIVQLNDIRKMSFQELAAAIEFSAL